MKGNMDTNQLDIVEVYGKLNALYSAVIYLNKEIKKEQDKLKQLKGEDKQNG